MMPLLLGGNNKDTVRDKYWCAVRQYERYITYDKKPGGL
jgi:hypothetical protein